MARRIVRAALAEVKTAANNAPAFWCDCPGCSGRLTAVGYNGRHGRRTVSPCPPRPRAGAVADPAPDPGLLRTAPSRRPLSGVPAPRPGVRALAGRWLLEGHAPACPGARSPATPG